MSNKPKILKLNFKKTEVEISIARGLVSQKEFIKKTSDISTNIAIITDSNVKDLYGDSLKNIFKRENIKNTLIIEVPAGEKHKSRKIKEYIEDTLLKNKFGKDTLIIALGGGVICDIAAFVASSYYRGVPLVMIPTTLLAMVDASIGGKCGLNTTYGKNLIGCFYHPSHIFIDPSFLDTLPSSEYLNGFSEIIKYALILDKNLFNDLYEGKDKIDIEELIYRCAQLKKQIVEKDEKESFIRSILNFGHTIGHSIEQLEDYKMPHGEAISIGMIFAAYLSVKQKTLEITDFLKIFSIFKKYKYPLVFSSKVSWNKIFESLCYDKKAKNGISRFILLKNIGEVAMNDQKYLHEIDNIKLKNALIWLYKRFIYK